MRKLLFIAILLVPALTHATTVVQHTSAQNAFSGNTVGVFGSATTAGDGLVAVVIGEGTSGGVGNVSTITDSVGNTWVYDNNILGSTGCPPTPANCINAYIYHVASCAAGTPTVTVTWTGSGTNQSGMFLIEFSSPLTVDVISTWQQTGGANNIATGSATATTNDVIVGFDDFEYQSANNNDPSTSQSASPTWTDLDHQNINGVGFYADDWVYLSATAGSYSNTFTVSSSNRSEAGGFVAFTPGAAGVSRHRAYVINR